MERSVVLSESHSKATAIRVLLVDDHVLVRQCLRSALREYPNIEVIGQASDGEEALACVAKLHPTIVVMDINMRKLDGITATRLIKTQHPEIAVIGLSVELRDYSFYAMQKAGASEVLQKEHAVYELYSAIQRAVAAVQPVFVMEDTAQQITDEAQASATTEMSSETQRQKDQQDDNKGSG